MTAVCQLLIRCLSRLLHHNPHLGNRNQIRQRIVSLYEAGQCGHYAGKGRALVEFNPSAGGIVAVATVNGRHTARFLVDTGASYVALTTELAAKMGVKTNEPDVLVDTANGPTQSRSFSTPLLCKGRPRPA